MPRLRHGDRHRWTAFRLEEPPFFADGYRGRARLCEWTLGEWGGPPVVPAHRRGRGSGDAREGMNEVAVTIYEDHLEVKVTNAPCLKVLYRDVGLRQSESVGVGGPN